MGVAGHCSMHVMLLAVETWDVHEVDALCDW